MSDENYAGRWAAADAAVMIPEIERCARAEGAAAERERIAKALDEWLEGRKAVGYPVSALAVRCLAEGIRNGTWPPAEEK